MRESLKRIPEDFEEEESLEETIDELELDSY